MSLLHRFDLVGNFFSPLMVNLKYSATSRGVFFHYYGLLNIQANVGSNRMRAQRSTRISNRLNHIHSGQLAQKYLQCFRGRLCGAPGQLLLVPSARTDELTLVRILPFLKRNRSSNCIDAASTSGAFNFELSETAGTKIVSRDVPSPVTTLALVSKAGSRYQWLPGLAEGLEKFAFRVRYLRFGVGAWSITFDTDV
jgi:hypothetical protein